MSWFRFPLALAMSLSLFLTSVVPSNVQASTLERYEVKTAEIDKVLEEIFDRFHYAIAVEWDQKDPLFKSEAEKQLITSLEDSGITAREIENYLARRLLSRQASEEFTRLMHAMRKQDYSPTQAAAMSAEFVKNNYAEGVHFHGEGSSSGNKWTVIIAVVVVALVAHWLIKKHKDGGKHDHDHDHDDGDTVIIIVK